MIHCELAEPSQLQQIKNFLTPYFEAELLLPRNEDDLMKLMKIGFVAQTEGQIVGFAALEIYSRKLAEIQCLAVDPGFRGKGIAKQLVTRCIAAAKKNSVIELMAISNADALFKQCGFDYSLPNQKRALFVCPQDFDA